MSFPRNSAVRPPSILKPIARVLNGTSPVVMFGAVETDNCSNFLEKLGVKCRYIVQVASDLKFGKAF